jgi:hypothetical protein
MIDIIMLSYEPSEKTMKAIYSLLNGTKEDCVIHIVKAKQSCSKNRNEMLKRELSDPYVSCDDDIEVNPGWLEGLKKHMKEDVGMVCGKMLKPDGTVFPVLQSLNEGEIFTCAGTLTLNRNLGILADEEFVGSQYDDTDTCYEYRKRGYKIISTHDVEFKHHSQLTQADNEFNRDYFNFKWNEEL